MKRVVTVNLSNMSFNFDEDAYDALRTYLARAEAQLANDPGRAEVIADIERSIAEKCRDHLNPQKSVITAEETRAVLAQIGVVEARYEERAQAEGATFDSASEPRSKQLVQIREGALVSGICNGVAAHFGVDVMLTRVIFVALAIATSGAFLFVYAAMMFLIPYDTNIEKVNDQSLPGFMFKFVTHTKRKLGTS